MGGLLGFFWRQATFKPRPIPDTVRLDGKTAIITGANVGLGLAVAKEMAAHGLSRVILGVRNVQKGDEARLVVLAAAPECDVQVWEVDQESFESMCAFADKAKTLDRLDLVILNAGLKVLEFTKAKTGHELHVQVNHIGTALLSLLLLEPLRRTAKTTGSPSRMTFVSSEVHFWTKFEERLAPNILARMNEESSFDRKNNIDRYYASKLLGLLWARELSGRVPMEEVLINMVNPGFVASKFHRGHQALKKLNFISWTPEEGGHTLADAATGYEGQQGVYISEQVVKKPSSFVLSPEGQKTQTKIWDETVELLQKEVPDLNVADILPSQ